jgi:hypothetical protein
MHLGGRSYLSLEVSCIEDVQGRTCLLMWETVSDRDLPFCGGNCSTTTPSIPAKAKESFPNARFFDASIIPEAGHGLNMVSVHIPRHEIRCLATVY